MEAEFARLISAEVETDVAADRKNRARFPAEMKKFLRWRTGMSVIFFNGRLSTLYEVVTTTIRRPFDCLSKVIRVTVM